jgi:hypothetical protein
MVSVTLAAKLGKEAQVPLRIPWVMTTAGIGDQVVKMPCLG